MLKKTQWPPGLVGEIAEYIYFSSIKPIKEVSIAAAIGLMSGITNRCYSIQGTGLNAYIIVLCKTGIGKEECANGISRIVNAMTDKHPKANIEKFIGPGDFSSGQALLKRLQTQPSFYALLGEIGETLKKISSPKAASYESSFRTALLDLYNKSGPGNRLLTKAYSDSSKDLEPVKRPGVTLLGESNPNTFFEGMSESVIANGLIPRFTIVEYDGDRPETNYFAFIDEDRTQVKAPPKDLIKKIATITESCCIANETNSNTAVKMSKEARKMLDDFDKETTKIINNSDQEIVLQLWNRAHLKSLKLAALLAVSNDFLEPVITENEAAWALDFTRNEVESILKRYNSGSMSGGAAQREYDLVNCVNKFLVMNGSSKRKYKIPESIINSPEPVIPYGYISRYLKQRSSFANNNTDTMRLIKETISDMITSDKLIEVSSIESWEIFETRAKLYLKGPQWPTY